MNRHWALLSLLVVAGALPACSDKGGDTGALPVIEGPSLEHTPPAGPFFEGDAPVLGATATDPDGVAEVVVFYRPAGGSFWEMLPMAEADGAWSVALPAVTAPGVEYYLRATDAGSPAGVTVGPDGAPSTYHRLDVGPLAQSLPFVEDFELGEGETSLLSLDWWAPSEAFNGYPFQLSSGRASSGQWSVVHPRGPEAAGELVDWLVSPPLDFSTLPAAMVHWMEYGASVDGMEEHGLYISTSERDPSMGTFVPVEAALPAPVSGAWGRSKAYDLSAWAGEPVVYLGWKYRGTAADDWAIDDVTVRALAADLQASLLWLPDPVHPGESANLTVVLVNGTAAPATNLEATLVFPEGGASAATETVPVADIAAEGTGQADFSVDIDPSWPDHSLLPLEVSLTDGTDTWSFPLEMVVGQRSFASVDLTLLGDAFTEVVVGVGDPAAPVVERTVSAENLVAGTYTLSVDITDLRDLLPPGPGDARWFARVESNSFGTLDAFTIDFGGESTAATRSAAFAGGLAALAYAPEPPIPAVIATAPSSLAPGDVGRPLEILLRNDGSATTGPVSATLSSADPDITVDNPAVTFDADLWTPGETRWLSGPLVTVGAGQDDATPARFSLVLDDGLESWESTLDIPVPWPVFRTVSIAVDDSGGDGLLDAGESAALEIELANVGSLGSTGPVEAVLSVVSGPASVVAGEGYFGTMAVGVARDDDFTLQVDAGASPGDVVELLLSLTDNTHSYTARASVTLGEPPWSTLALRNDATGDALNGYGFDFVNARSRVFNGNLELWLESAVPVDPATLFIEAWGTSAGAPYSYYRLVLQSGVGTLQGYTASGFQRIGSLTARFPDANSVILSLPTDDLATPTNSLSIGLAAGWCGPPTYYCDHFPDAWGYPYDAFSTGGWFSLRW